MSDIVLRQRPAPSVLQRVKLWAARRRHEPVRDTKIYPRLFQVGSWGVRDTRAIVKPVPANLRYFSRTVYASRAIAFYTQSISNLDWHVTPKAGVKENPEIKRQIEVTQACLMHPNKDDSLVSLIQQVVEDVCVSGAGTVEPEIGGDPARPLWLWPVDALSIQIYADWDGDEGKPRYCQTYGYGNVGVSKGKDLLNSELVYMRDRPTTDSPFSVGMLEVAFQSINRQLGVAEYAGKLAANAQPQNMLYLAGATQDEIEQFRAFWRNEIEGQGQTPIMGAQGEKSQAQVVSLRGADDNAVYLKYQQFLIREIAAAFNISPQNLSIEADVNRNTSEVAEDRDWDIAIKPRARMIAAYLNREVIQGKLGYYQIELTPGGLDREDEKAGADIYRIEYEGNAILPNEYRARRNMPPLKSAWADMTYADAQIAIHGATGAKQINPDLVDKE